MKRKKFISKFSHKQLGYFDEAHNFLARNTNIFEEAKNRFEKFDSKPYFIKKIAGWFREPFKEWDVKYNKKFENYNNIPIVTEDKLPSENTKLWLWNQKMFDYMKFFGKSVLILSLGASIIDYVQESRSQNISPYEQKVDSLWSQYSKGGSYQTMMEEQEFNKFLKNNFDSTYILNLEKRCE